MKRYDLVYNDWAGYEYLASPIEREDGDWVSVEDAADLEAQLAEAREACKAAVAALDNYGHLDKTHRLLRKIARGEEG